MQAVKAQIMLALLGLAAVSAAQAAEPVPRPKLRPAPAAATEAVPIPQQKPASQAAAPAKAATQPAPVPGNTGGWPADVVAAGRSDCKALLAGLDLSYTPVDPIGTQGGCGAPAPIEVTSVAGVNLTPPATQTCAMAAALVAWVKDDVQPAAMKRLGTAVTEIRTATSYACRRRNNGSSGKMSEHSKANALDMSGFTFAKSAGVTVGGKDNWGAGLLGALGLSKGGSFLEDIRKAACTHFTTVLGPGSDPFHGDHFHVDVLQRKGGYRICQ
jgi:hypothetical protein